MTGWPAVVQAFVSMHRESETRSEPMWCALLDIFSTWPDSMLLRQAPLLGFHSLTSPAAADSSTASSEDSASARGPERCPGVSMEAAFLGSSSSLMAHACAPPVSVFANTQ